MGAAHMQAPERSTARIALAIALLLLVLLLALRFALQPERATRFLLARVGASLGLEITASGAAEYHLRGTPTLVIRDVVAREPGAAEPLLTADRILLALPWSTVRARGAVLEADRLELDAPVLQLDALLHWLSTRPPSEAPRFPTFEQGLQVRDGTLRPRPGGDWRIVGLDIALPYLAPDAPLQARLDGRYEAPPTRVPFDVAVALQRAGALVDATPVGAAIVGRLAIIGGDWRMPAHVRFSGPLLLREGDVFVAPLTAGLGAQYDSKDSSLPFALGARGPLQVVDGAMSLAPVHLAVSGRKQPASADPIPRALASGRVALDDALALELEGRVARWPQAWPALPEPLGRPDGPVRVAIDYRGPAAFDGVVRLRAAHDATRFDGRFRIADITRWLDTDLANPLPPMDATAHTPVLEIAGARLEGVEIEVDDPSVEGAVQ